MSDSYEYLYGEFPILRAERSPCPVCGHPTGDCAGTTKAEMKTLFGLRMFKSLDDQQTFTVMEDVFEEREVIGGATVKFRKYKAGQIIPLGVAREEGLTEL